MKNHTTNPIPQFIHMSIEQKFDDVLNVKPLRDGFFYLHHDLFRKTITCITKYICAN